MMDSFYIKSTLHVTINLETLTFELPISIQVSESDVYSKMSKLSAISWWEQEKFGWDDVPFILDQHALMDFYSVCCSWSGVSLWIQSY
jgi:hypothetical protein